MKENVIEAKSYQFALRIVNAYNNCSAERMMETGSFLIRFSNHYSSIHNLIRVD
jgi:hypothetical protein